MINLKNSLLNINSVMSCPVVSTIAELYGGYEYADTSSSPKNETSILIPSGFSGGGSVSTDISMELAKFYITMRKLQFARAELTEQNRTVSSTAVPSTTAPATVPSNMPSIIESALASTSTLADTIKPSVYFERMFADYYGKSSKQILKRILGQSKIYIVLTRAVDLIDIMESVCISTLARDFPSGMSIPTVYFDPSAIENIELPANITSEINKIIDYANKLCVGGLRTTIEPMSKFDASLREFTFPKAGEESWTKLLEYDMEVATYAYALEHYQCDAIKKINEVMNLCQSIIDLSSK
jgi:hypothetical protein